ncbi:FeoA family protein [Desulfobulbus oligotrophicus]|jgi:Fe2+ transport system protein FeoA|uniref:Ferrous iron transport protein A n=1 Tax=Desulfobulbus oligotrophicus TaxID=1909699 RepID=A0A7T6APT9_9BACT|nr:FeoA family protein [Desulfobulbus oligotrophicus]QQG65018.1 ferrous iron transport protein A [Desulfobulbus oligotrophicus]
MANSYIPSHPLVLAGEGEVVKVVSLRGGHKFRGRLLSMGINVEDTLVVVHKQPSGAVLIEKSGCRYGLGGGMAHKINVIKVE